MPSAKLTSHHECTVSLKSLSSHFQNIKVSLDYSQCTIKPFTNRGKTFICTKRSKPEVLPVCIRSVSLKQLSCLVYARNVILDGCYMRPVIRSSCQLQLRAGWICLITSAGINIKVCQGIGALGDLYLVKKLTASFIV